MNATSTGAAPGSANSDLYLVPKKVRKSRRHREIGTGPMVFVIWNVDKRRAYLKMCHPTRELSEAFLAELLLPYPPRDNWRRRLRVAGPMPQRTSWKMFLEART